MSALHFAADAHHEPCDEDGKELAFFNMILSYKPNVDLPLENQVTLLCKYVTELNFKMVKALVSNAFYS